MDKELPLPVAQAFVVCREILQDRRTGDFVLLGPTSYLSPPAFPVNIRLSVFAHLTGGHGQYRLQVCLRDGDDETVWQWEPTAPFEHPDPLLPHHLAFHDLVLPVPRAGRYRLALLANGCEFAQQPLWLGPRDAFV